jgi:hypothetical protein
VKVIYISALLFCFIFIQCKQSKKQTVETLLKIDKEFSGYSSSNVITKSFLKCCAKNGAIERDSSKPLIETQFISNLYNTTTAEIFILNWVIMGAEMVASGELSYTFSKYQASSDYSLKQKLLEVSYVTGGKKMPEVTGNGFLMQVSGDYQNNSKYCFINECWGTLFTMMNVYIQTKIVLDA